MTEKKKRPPGQLDPYDYDEEQAARIDREEAYFQVEQDREAEERAKAGLPPRPIVMPGGKVIPRGEEAKH
jgi:hypothetical protein